ncbi:MAG: hypothetical protein JMJ93_10810 [Synergistaceae bacterium]|nr:hypothetical protein [Synergistaceae bacterium]
MESILLLFDAHHPVWTAEGVRRAGENPELLEALRSRGDLKKQDRFYLLTEEGATRYRQAAQDCFHDAQPGERPHDLARWALRTELEQLLNRSFLGRWGIKEFRNGASLPYAPALDGEELFRLGKDGLRWTYEENAIVRELKARYPKWKGPETPLPDREAFRSWMAARGAAWERLTIDVFFLHRYDAEVFQSVTPHPNDELALYHKDRFFFRLLPGGVPSTEELCRDLGRLHLFLLLQRRIFLPWAFDRDTTDHDSINWWFWVTESQEELQRLQKTVTPLAPSMTEAEAAQPLELFGISLEALRAIRGQREYHWDLFQEVALALSR